MLRYLKILLAIFFYVASSYSFSQSELKFYLVDESNFPVAYANIFSKSAQSGAYSDLNGRVVLPKVRSNDSVKISCIGFETVKMSVSELSDTLVLIHSVKELEEFTIKSEYIEEELGILKRIKFNDNKDSGGYAGYVEGIVFPEVRKSFLQDVSLYIEKPNDSSRIQFLLMIYEVNDSTLFPTSPILTEQIFFDISKKGWSTINLDSLNIFVDGNIFVGFETVPNYNFSDAPKFYEYTSLPCARYGFISYFFKKLPYTSVYGHSGIQYFLHGGEDGNGSHNNFAMLKFTIKY